jgi:hypothetical protein
MGFPSSTGQAQGAPSQFGANRTERLGSTVGTIPSKQGGLNWLFCENSLLEPLGLQRVLALRLALMALHVGFRVLDQIAAGLMSAEIFRGWQ